MVGPQDAHSWWRYPIFLAAGPLEEKRGKSDSPSLFSFYSLFAVFDHNSHGTGMTPATPPAFAAPSRPTRNL
jgi:hypothetical protein